jgi:hypothetical protein
VQTFKRFLTKASVIALALLVAAGMAGAAAAQPTMSGCSFEYGSMSVHKMTKDGSPVIFQWFECSGQLKRRYVDFLGQELGEHEMVPNELSVVREFETNGGLI